MKVDEALQVLVNDQCPTCWKPVGEHHDDDCYTAALILKNNKKTIRSSVRDPFENDSDWVKEKVKKYRKPKPEAKTTAQAPSTPKPKLGTVGDYLDTVYAQARELFHPKCQVWLPETVWKGHLRDVPSKHIPVDGHIKFTCKMRNGDVLGYLRVHTVKRAITEIEEVK